MKQVDPRRLAERLAVLENTAKGIEEPDMGPNGNRNSVAHDHWDSELNKLTEEIYQEITGADEDSDDSQTNDRNILHLYDKKDITGYTSSELNGTVSVSHIKHVPTGISITMKMTDDAVRAESDDEGIKRTEIFNDSLRRLVLNHYK